MQKKLIALAVAGLLSAPAFAQSNVTIYGTVDYGFTSLGSHAVPYTYSYDAQNDMILANPGTRPKARSGIDSGISKNNRLGFRGSEDLGNGLKAVFVLETGLQGDGQHDHGLFNGVTRQAYAGLAGGFGTVAFGRQYTPQHLFTAAVDPFGKQGLGNAGNIMMQDTRLSNLVAYISPNWGGFSFVAGWTWNGGTAGNGMPDWVGYFLLPGATVPVGGQNEAVANDGDVQVWAIAPSFTWNNLFVGVNYHQAKVNSNPGSSFKAVNVWDLMASYDFGFVKVGGVFGQRKSNAAAYNRLVGVNDDVKTRQWMLGATFRITPNDSILTSYTRVQEDGLIDDVKSRIGQWAIGYEHALSKRTVLYSQFAKQSWNNDAETWRFHSIQTDSTIGGVGVRQLTGGGAAPYKRGFAVGFRHDF